MIATTVWDNKEWSVDFDEIGTGIYVYHNAFTPEMDIVNRVEASLAIPGTRFAWQTAGLNFGHTDEAHRKCKDFKVREDTLGQRDEYSEDLFKLHKEIMDSVKTCISHYCPNNFLSGINYYECINIVRYGSGEYFKVHTDDGEPYRCTTSLVGYPNDNYTGGELTFPKFNLSYKPKAGDLVIFPSSYVYAHASEPVTDDGIKYSLVIMSDRNEFAHRNDSPTFYPKEYREQFGVPKV